MRHIVNFGLLFSFLTLATTGGLAFFRPFSLVTTRIHIVFGIATVVLVGLHLSSRLPYFKSQLKPKGRAGVSRPLLAGIVAGWALLLASAFWNWAPAGLVIGQGYEAKHQAEIIRVSSLARIMEASAENRIVARDAKEGADASLSLAVSFGEQIETLPSIAIWTETSTGAMIETIYLDPGLAYSKSPEWNGKPTPRHQILPLWRHRYTMLSGIDPMGEIDAYSGATATHSFTLDDYLKLGEEKSFVLCVEVNAPADPNEHYPDTHFGQPSLFYTAYIELDSGKPYTLLELTGHGGGAETSGAIQYDLDEFTTARSLIDLLLAKVETVADAP